MLLLALLVLPAWACAQAWEMVTVSTTPTGPTAALCQVGTQVTNQRPAVIVILDQPVWFTWHGPQGQPSATQGGLAPANSQIQVDRATDFKAVRQGATDARIYVVCVP